MSEFKRNVLPAEKAEPTVAVLQRNLVTLIDLALQLKQAHWTVVGPNFRSLHLQLDEILLSVRDATDEIAERIVQIGFAPDGRAVTVASESQLSDIGKNFSEVAQSVTAVADRLSTAIGELRKAIDELDDLDLVSQDMTITIAAALEKHLWMVQSQEVR